MFWAGELGLSSPKRRLTVRDPMGQAQLSRTLAAIARCDQTGVPKVVPSFRGL